MPEIKFGAEDWEKIRENYTAWWEKRLERPLVYLSGVSESRHGKGVDGWYGFLTNYPPEVTPARIVRKFVEAESRRRYVGDTYPQWFMNFGAGVLAAALGARVNTAVDTVWFEPPPGAGVDNLKIKFDAQTYWWRRIEAVTKKAVEEIGGTVQVSYTDIGGNLDILSSLLGAEPLAMALIDDPEKIERASREVTAVWLRVFDELDGIIRAGCPGSQSWAPVWAPGSSYMLQSDFSYMISPEMFARFVMPDLEACCGHIEYPFYHLDGVGELPHLEQLLSIKKLRGIQWIPGDGKPPAHEWRNLLRRIRRAGKLVQIFTTAEGARDLCREIDGGRGFLLVINDEMSLSKAKEYLKGLERLY